jgi:hypothetical protein
MRLNQVRRYITGSVKSTHLVKPRKLIPSGLEIGYPIATRVALVVVIAAKVAGSGSFAKLGVSRVWSYIAARE